MYVLATLMMLVAGIHCMEITISSNKEVALPRETVVITCIIKDMLYTDAVKFVKKVQGDPHTTYTISYENTVQGQFLPTGRYSIEKTSTGAGVLRNARAVLTINGANVRDSGEIGCKVQQSVKFVPLQVLGPVTEITLFHKTLNQPYQPLMHNSYVEFSNGDSLMCEIKAYLPAPTVSIMVGDRNDTLKFSSVDLPAIDDGSSGLLAKIMHLKLQNRLFNLREEDNGKKLTCRASVPNHQDKEVSIILGKKAPPMINCQRSSAYIGQDVAKVVCNVISNPTLESYKWSWNNGANVLRQDGRLGDDYISESSVADYNHTVTLSIYNIQQGKFGTYTIEAKNAEGTYSSMVILTETSRPKTTPANIEVSSVTSSGGVTKEDGPSPTKGPVSSGTMLSTFGPLTLLLLSIQALLYC